MGMSACGNKEFGVKIDKNKQISDRPHNNTAWGPTEMINWFQLINRYSFEITDREFRDNISVPTQQSGSQQFP